MLNSRILLVALLLIAPPVFAQRAAPPAQPARATERGPSQRFGLAKAPPKTQGAIRIGAYNVLNLFDHVDDPALTGEFDDLPMATSDDRCRAMAAAIRELNADVLALQEVESLEALTWFRDTYLKGMGYDHIASIDVGYFRGVEQSVLSRFPIVETRTWTDARLDRVRRTGLGWADVPPGERGDQRGDERNFRHQRSPLMVTIKVNDDYRFTLLSVHHKAGRDFNHHREAEALHNVEVIRELLKEDPSRNIVVAGDFNCAPWDKSMRVYLEAGLIDTLSHRSTQRDSDESAQYRTHESARVLDYILLNSAAHREFVVGSAFVLGTLHPGDDYDWRTDTPPRGYASDHYPVAIDLMPKDVK